MASEKNYTVTLLRIIATAFILICHIGTALAIGFVAQSFSVGVQIFLFISGFLYGRKEIRGVFSWIKNRVIRVMIPMLIYVVACLIVAVVVHSEFSWWSLPLYAFNVQGYAHFIEFIPQIKLIEGTEHLWFLTVLFICYGLTILVKKVHINREKMPKWLMVLICILIVLTTFAASYFGVRLDYILIYFIGYAISSFKVKTNWVTILISFGLAASFVVARFLLKRYCDEHGDIALYTQIVIPLSCIGLTLFLYFGLDWLVNITKNIKFFHAIYASKFTGFLDSVSYPIYICHYILIASSVSVFLLEIHVVLKVLIFLVGSFILGVALYFICLPINNSLIKRNNEPVIDNKGTDNLEAENTEAEVVEETAENENSEEAEVPTEEAPKEEKKEKEIKKESLKLNFIFNIIYQVVAVLSPIILTPKLSRVFGADYLGVKSYTFSIVYYFAIFGLLGLDMLGQRKIALVKDDLEKRSKTFWTIFVTRFSLVMMSTLLFVGYVFLFGGDEFQKVVFFCWTIYLFREMINPIWYLQGIEKYRFLSILSIISNIAYVVLTFVFINEKEQLPLYVIIFTAVPLLISLTYFPLVFKYTKFVKFTFKDMAISVKESFVYFVPTIATAIYSMVDKTMLGAFDESKVSAGLYEAAEKLVKVALAISTASYTIMRTRMSYLYGKQDKEKFSEQARIFTSFSMMLCWPIMLGVAAIAKDFVPVFFGDGFEEVINLSYVFAIIVPCLTISGLLQAIYIFPYGLQKEMDLYFIIIVVVNIGMNLLLIYFFGTIGAVISSVTSEAILATILIIRSRKVINIKHLFLCSIKYIISALAMFGVIIVISLFVNFPDGIKYQILKVAIEFVAGVLTYYAFCLILRDRFVWYYTRVAFNMVFRRKKKEAA